MQAVRGIFDGEKIIATDHIPTKKKFKVIITFVEEVVETNDSRDFTAQTDGLSFWHDEREDLYQDYLKEK
ncbi:MAG: hypothetical protein WA960_14840 [Tunicatimonas sp.]